MKLDRVTITGADDSVSPDDLRKLSDEFPYVEWALLFSPKYEGSPRWPSRYWCHTLATQSAKYPLKLSAHLCGGYMRSAMHGEIGRFRNDVPTLAPLFQRMQFNFHANKENVDHELLRTGMAADSPSRQYIFQIDGVNDSIFEEASGVFDAVPFFDGSHGEGVLPGAWPKAECIDVKPDVDGNPIESLLYHGYGGGLGPDTLETQLPLIAAAAGDARVWIDMETRVRSSDDKQFDLAKVRRCLEICKPWITT